MRKLIIILLLILFSLDLAIAQNSEEEIFELDSVNSNSKKLELLNADYKSPRTYDGEARFILLGQRFDDSIVNARFGGVFIGAKLDVLYKDWLKARLNLLQLLSTGTQSTLYGVEEGGSPNVLLLNEVYLELIPNEYSSGKMGVLEIRMNPILSQMFPQNNPGYELDFHYKNSIGALQFLGSQSVPGSKKSNRVLDEDANPLFSTANLNAQLGSEEDNFVLEAAAARFIFTDLSSSDAEYSSKRGSSTVGNGRGGFLYTYDYRGNEYSLGVSQIINLKNSISLKGSTIRNELAPQGSNSGWQGRFDFKSRLNSFDLIPSYTKFRMESDALPASAANFLYGFTNREGSVYSLKMDFPKEKFSAFASYVKANVISNTALSSQYQADREVYTIGAEAKYDLF